jgi:hypothetical protein
MDLFRHAGLWKARRELDEMFSDWRYSQILDRFETRAQRCVEILRAHPSLATKRYKGKLQYPLSFLLEAGADLASVQEVYGMYPPALSQRVTLLENCRIFPLHVACQRGLVPDNVIPFLVESFPRAAKQKNWHREGPLHLLLQNPRRSASVVEVEALLDIYEEALIEQKSLKGTALAVAFRSGHTHQEILNLLIQRLPKDFVQLDLGGGTNNMANGVVALSRRSDHKKIGLTQSRALCKVLPQLKVFNCIVHEWEPNAFKAVLYKFRHLPKLEELTLCVPPPSTTKDTDFEALRLLLTNSSNLQRILLDFTLYRKDTSGLEVLRTKVSACLQHLLIGLDNNHSLLEVYICGGIKALNEEYFRLEFWPSVCRILANNTVLQRISISRMPGDVNHIVECEQVCHLLTYLNRFGRRKFRDPSLNALDIVGLLVQVNQSFLVDKQNRRLDVLYCLLHEAPAIWSSF